MSTKEFPTSLPSLSTREAITDALHRAIIGLDAGEADLFDSAFTEDAIFDLNGTVSEGLQAIHTDCYDRVAKLDTTHLISNVRLNFKEGDSKASLTATAMAQHYRLGQGVQPGAASLMSGVLYFLDCVKDDKTELWKIKYWKLKLIWTQGDFAVVTGN